MRGELIGVWSETSKHVWSEVAAHEAAPNDLYCELFRELSPALKICPTVETLADIIDDPMQSKEAFEKTRSEDLANERTIVNFVESAHAILDDLGGDPLANRYFNLLSTFIDKFSLRYDLRRPCILCPTLSGIFSSLVRDLRIVSSRDAHLDGLMKDFENAIRDLRADCSDGRIRTCIQKQVNLLEALGQGYPGVSGNTLGAICNQINSWPHEKIKDAIKSLYAFTCDYPGIRHGGSPRSAIRLIEMRDMVAMSILLAGFTPYLTDQLSADDVYGGAGFRNLAVIPPQLTNAPALSGRSSLGRLGTYLATLLDRVRPGNR